MGDYIQRLDRAVVMEILELNGFEPTGQEDGDRDWLVQLYRSNQIKDGLPSD